MRKDRQVADGLIQSALRRGDRDWWPRINAGVVDIMHSLTRTPRTAAYSTAHVIFILKIEFTER